MQIILTISIENSNEMPSKIQNALKLKLIILCLWQVIYYSQRVTKKLMPLKIIIHNKSKVISWDTGIEAREEL